MGNKNSYIDIVELGRALDIMEVTDKTVCGNFYRAFGILEAKGIDMSDIPNTEKRVNACMSAMIALDTAYMTGCGAGKGFILRKPYTIGQKVDAILDIRVFLYQELYRAVLKPTDSDVA